MANSFTCIFLLKKIHRLEGLRLRHWRKVKWIRPILQGSGSRTKMDPDSALKGSRA